MLTRVTADANRDKMRRILLHAVQVQDGLIPADSPDDFTLPKPLTAQGLPWFVGPDYKPSTEAIEEFTKPNR